MFFCSAHRVAIRGLLLAISVAVFFTGITIAFAQDAPLDAISRSIQEQMELREKRFAQFNAQRQNLDTAIGTDTNNLNATAIAQQPVQLAVLPPGSNFDDISQLPQFRDIGLPVNTLGVTTSTESLQRQIDSLQRQIAQIQAGQTADTGTKDQNTAPAGNPAPSGKSGDSIHNMIKTKTGVDITLGGWFDGTMIYRSKNESADFISNLNTSIPFNNAVNAHQSEFRETARATRLRLTVGGDPDPDSKLGAFIESDFYGAAPTATSTSTNSYTPRLYQAFFTYDRTDLGLHAMAGQAFSMLTMNKAGIDPMTPNIPLTIDSSFGAGFNYTRNPQLRLVEDFDNKKLWIGISAESPQAVVSGLPCTANASAGTCSGFNSTYSVTSTPSSSSFANNVTTDTAPDLIIKTAYDPGWGHYEIFGITRFFHDNVDASYHNNVVIGGGGGANMNLPVIRNYLDVQAQFMMGDGVGRYGATQMPDFAIMPNGALKPIHEQTAMAGIVGHPDSSWDIYLYTGEEKVFRMNSVNTAYGYGDFGTANSGCYTLGGTCAASTSSVEEFIIGFWKRLYDGHYGKVQLGVQNSIIRRNAFSDSVGSAPHSYEDVAMSSFRYFPF